MFNSLLMFRAFPLIVFLFIFSFYPQLNSAQNVEGAQETIEPYPINLDEILERIKYPVVAKDAGIQGDVIVKVLIDSLGNYERHEVIQEVHPVLYEAVERELPKLKFQPAMAGEKAMPFWATIPFKFHMLTRQEKQEARRKRKAERLQKKQKND